LRVRVLGGLAVEGVDLTRLGSRKARRLLARLALARGAPVSVDALIDTVWGDDPPSQPAEQLSVLISRLRSAMHTALPRTAAGYALEAGWLDVAALAELVAEAQARMRSGAPAPARAAAQAALDLLRGPLLPDEEDASWLAAERAAVARDAAAARLLAAEAALAVGDPWAAARLADEALAVERFDEAALRVLMAAHARAGRPALALRAYAEMSTRLEEELGVDPAPETSAVHLSVLRGQSTDAPVLPLPGRSAELARLRAAFDLGAGRLVVVDGPAGIGKTRLLDEFARRLDGATVLRATGEELGGGLPLQPILDGLADHVELDYPRDTPQLSASGANLLTAALDRVTAELCARGRVVWLLDDAQWADQPTIAWLHHVVRRMPVLAILARRPEEGTAVRPHETVHLGPLDRSAVAEVLGSQTSTQRADDLFQRSGGHPMFLLELARSTGELPESIRDAVAERCDRAGPSTAATLRAAAVLGPDVDLDLLAAVLAARPSELLDHLEEGVRRHLLAETGTGFAFAHQLVRAALRASTSTGRAALLHREAASWLAQRGTADPGDVAFHALRGGDRRLAARALAAAAEIASSRFEHEEAERLLDEALALVDEPAYRIARARTRVQAGRLADADADATEALAVAVEPIDRAAALEAAALVAYHRRDIDRCRTLAEQGAAEATRAGSAGRGGADAMRAGSAGWGGAEATRDGSAGWGGAEATRDGSAGPDGAQATRAGAVRAEAMRAGSAGPPVADETRAGSAGQRAAEANRSGAVELTAEAMRASADELAASCLAIAGRAALVLGDLSTSNDLLTQARERTTGPVRPIADLNLAWLHAQADRPADALRVLAATEPVRASRVPFLQPQRHLAAAHAYAHLGRIADAFVELDRLEEASAREHTERYAGRADNYRGWILRNLGDVTHADDLNARALDAARQIRMGEPFAHAALDLCDAALRRGDPATALDLLATAADTGDMPHAYRWRHELRARLLSGRCALATGDFPAALETLDGVRAEAAQIGLRRYRVIAAVLLAEARYRAGERVNPASIAADVQALDEVASLESWWLTTALAQASGVDEWHTLAEQRVARLAADAGAHAASLHRAWAALK
jgi:DNA-binding SARP family transcriptional activator/tetratricopeptide (TPR) repeat protein